METRTFCNLHKLTAMATLPRGEMDENVWCFNIIEFYMSADV